MSRPAPASPRPRAAPLAPVGAHVVRVRQALVVLGVAAMLVAQHPLGSPASHGVEAVMLWRVLGALGTGLLALGGLLAALPAPGGGAHGLPARLGVPLGAGLLAGALALGAPPLALLAGGSLLLAAAALLASVLRPGFGERRRLVGALVGMGGLGLLLGLVALAGPPLLDLPRWARALPHPWFFASGFALVWVVARLDGHARSIGAPLAGQLQDRARERCPALVAARWVPGGAALSLVVDGRTVAGRVSTDRLPIQVELEAAVEGVDPALQLVGTGPGERGSPSPDPLLQHLVRAEGPGAAVLPLARHHEAVLAFLQGHPGSEVRDGRATLRTLVPVRRRAGDPDHRAAERILDAVREALPVLLDLVAALEGAPPPPPPATPG